MTEYGLQLYSVRDVASDLWRTLEKVKKMGYSGVEFAGYYGFSAKEIKEMLDSFGLRAIGTHTRITELADDKLSETIDFHRAIGAANLNLPSANWWSEESFKQNIDVINFAAPRLLDAGITLGYHNHSGEFFKTPYGKIIENEILDKTDIKIEVDVFWLYNAGIDPISFVEGHRDRIDLLHIKDGISKRGMGADYKNSSNGAVGRSLGMGECPVAEVVKLGRVYGMEMVVESEDLAPTGIIEAQRCIEYLRSLE